MLRAHLRPAISFTAPTVRPDRRRLSRPRDRAGTAALSLAGKRQPGSIGWPCPRQRPHRPALQPAGVLPSPAFGGRNRLRRHGLGRNQQGPHRPEARRHPDCWRRGPGAFRRTARSTAISPPTWLLPPAPGWTRISLLPTRSCRSPAWPASRGLSADAVRQLLSRHTEGRQLGFLGEPRVNVLLLNLALDSLARR